MFERAEHKQVYNFIDEYKFSNKSQFVFRTRKPTSLAKMDLLECIYIRLDTGDQVISLFLDFRKKINCIDHEILFKKL